MCLLLKRWRRCLLGLVVLGILLAGSAIALMGSRRTTVTEKNCAQILPGMTQEQVEIILAGPPTSDTDLPVTKKLAGGEEVEVLSPEGEPIRWSRKDWQDNADNAIFVFLDHDGKVLIASFQKRPMSRIERIIEFIREKLGQ